MLFNNYRQYVPHQTHMPIHLFIMGVDWSEIGWMFNGSIYAVFAFQIETFTLLSFILEDS